MLIIKLSAIASTNSFLKDWVQQTKDYTQVAVWAEHQTNGRGRRNTKWQTVKGLNLTGSIYISASILQETDVFALNKRACVAVYKLLNDHQIPKLSIKWPNDILSGNKKLGGILVEPIMRGSTLTGIIIGCGINVNQCKFQNLPCATSMAICTDKEFSIEQMFENLANKIKTELTSKTDGHAAYMNLLYGFQEELTFKRKDGTSFEATITDVAQNGTLLLTHKHGQIEAFNEKEVIFKVSANCQ